MTKNTSKLISVETKATVKVCRKYDAEKYSDSALERARSALQDSLKSHKVAVSEFIKQVVFKTLSSDNVNKTFSEWYKKLQSEYTPEIGRLYTLAIKHFKGCLPVQSELDTLDVYMLLTPKKAGKPEVKHGAQYVLESLKTLANKKAKSKNEDIAIEGKVYAFLAKTLEANLKAF